jgi:hypothetical protein
VRVVPGRIVDLLQDAEGRGWNRSKVFTFLRLVELEMVSAEGGTPNGSVNVSPIKSPRDMRLLGSKSE